MREINVTDMIQKLRAIERGDGAADQFSGCMDCIRGCFVTDRHDDLSRALTANFARLGLEGGDVLYADLQQTLHHVHTTRP